MDPQFKSVTSAPPPPLIEPPISSKSQLKFKSNIPGIPKSNSIQNIGVDHVHVVLPAGLVPFEYQILFPAAAVPGAAVHPDGGFDEPELGVDGGVNPVCKQ